MIYLNKGTAELITTLAERATDVTKLADEDIVENIYAIQDIKKNLTDEHLKVVRTLGQLFVINNAEKLKRGIKEALDGQMSLFDYEEEVKQIK